MGVASVHHLLLACAATLFIGTSFGAAHPHNYAGVSEFLLPGMIGEVRRDCDGGLLGPLEFLLNAQLGHVCVPANHVPPTTGGTASVAINDGGIAPASGFYCQDRNSNVLCGDESDYGEPFCGSVWLDSFGEPGSSEVNWDPALPIYVYVNGAASGNPVSGPCGMSPSMGTAGALDHNS